MTRALVVCPATEDMELIEFAESPIGPLLHACSRFRPPTALACGRACARGARCDLASGEAVFDVESEVGDDTEVDVELRIALPILTP